MPTCKQVKRAQLKDAKDSDSDVEVPTGKSAVHFSVFSSCTYTDTYPRVNPPGFPLAHQHRPAMEHSAAAQAQPKASGIPGTPLMTVVTPLSYLSGAHTSLDATRVLAKWTSPRAQFEEAAGAPNDIHDHGAISDVPTAAPLTFPERSSPVIDVLEAKNGHNSEGGPGDITSDRSIVHDEGAPGEGPPRHSMKEEKSDEHAKASAEGAGDFGIEEKSTGISNPNPFRAPPPPALRSLDPPQLNARPDNATDSQSKGGVREIGGRNVPTSREEEVPTRTIVVVRGDKGSVGIAFKETKCLRPSDDDAGGGGSNGQWKNADAAGAGRSIFIHGVSPGSPAALAGRSGSWKFHDRPGFALTTGPALRLT